MVAGDVSCGPTDSNFSGSNPSTCQQRATANLISGLAPSYLLPGGDTQKTPTSSWWFPRRRTTSEATTGAGAQLQRPTSSNYLPGLVVRPTPGDHENGDSKRGRPGGAVERRPLLRQLRAVGPQRPPRRVTGPSNDFYSFDIPWPGGPRHIISLDSKCAALPAPVGGAPPQSAAGCASGSPEETFLRNDLIAHQGDCITTATGGTPAKKWRTGAGG